MCGRFALIHKPEELEDEFGLAGIDPFPPRYNIAPTQPILVCMAGPVREPGSNIPSRHAFLARWGFIPGWAKDPSQMPLMINARSETASEKASFRTAMRHRRALMPASGFYEWRRFGKRQSQAYWVRPRDRRPVAFGALVESWAEPGGSEIDTAAILTTEANPEFASIHDRMPVVIKPENYERWLDCVTREPRDVADLVRPVEEGFFEAIPVSDLVNKVANTAPAIQERVVPREMPVEDAGRADEPAQMKLF